MASAAGARNNDHVFVCCFSVVLCVACGLVSLLVVCSCHVVSMLFVACCLLAVVLWVGCCCLLYSVARCVLLVGCSLCCAG